MGKINRDSTFTREYKRLRIRSKARLWAGATKALRRPVTQQNSDPMATPIGGAKHAAPVAGRSNVDPRLPYDDLRQWIEEARRLGEIREVKGLSWQSEIGMVAEMALHSDE